eukprot:9672670-Lingulodinium_polyedra.AAC.1
MWQPLEPVAGQRIAIHAHRVVLQRARRRSTSSLPSHNGPVDGAARCGLLSAPLAATSATALASS